MISADALARRRASLAERFPALVERMAQGATDQLAIVVQDGEAVDVRVDDQQMYGGDARAFTRDQVAAYFKKPVRLFMNNISKSGLLSPICFGMIDALNEQLDADAQETVALHPVDSPCFLVVFGLGLGHHLEELVRRTKARWLILVEPFTQFFEQSLQVVDWPRLLADLEERGGKAHIITELDPGAVASAIVRAMDQHGIAYADGSWAFTHYPLWVFAEARKRLHEGIEFAFINRGFFEDEQRMMTNAVTNFSRHAFHLLEGRPRLARPETAIIVGAGPSLDESIAELHRIRDRVMLFSCGTALRPLLRNGLTPDFHCELENIPEVAGVLEETAGYGDLSGVTLIASATVDPRVPPLFGRTTFLFRDSVSSTEILGGSYRLVPGVAPTCVNLGVASAAFLGFTNLVLFGADCGTRPGGKRHAEGTIYRDLGAWEQKDRQRGHSIEVEGNFGGTIHTDWVYDACRLMLGSVIRVHRFTVLNCSNGALIPGARPCAPETLEIAGPPLDRAAIVARLERDMRAFAPGEILAETDLGALGTEAGRVFDRLDLALDELTAGAPDFAAVYDRTRALLREIAGEFKHCDVIVSGTLSALPRIAMFYGIRIGDPAVKARFFGRYMAEFRTIVNAMRQGTRELFDALVAEAGAARTPVAARAE